MKDRDSSTTVQVDEQEEETKPRMDERMKNGRNGRKMDERYTHKSTVQMDEQKENNQPNMDERDGR
jgi:hypothetical protein